MRRLLLVFLKFPEPGRVKTRIAAESTPDEAAEIYREMTAVVFGQVGKTDGFDLRVLFDPPEKEAEIRTWLAALHAPIQDFHPQSAGDLGARLAAAFQGGFEDGYGQVAVIGTDSPEIERRRIESSWAALDDGNDAAFGPAVDGGFYLLALNQPVPGLFEGIPWSAADTLEQCLQRSSELGLDVAILPALHDIDTLADWNRYLSER